MEGNIASMRSAMRLQAIRSRQGRFTPELSDDRRTCVPIVPNSSVLRRDWDIRVVVRLRHESKVAGNVSEEESEQKFCHKGV